MRSLISVLVICFLMPVVQECFAQSPDYNHTVKYINTRLGSKCSIAVEKGNLVAKFYDEKRKLIRDDKAFFKELDYTKIGYEETEKILFIPCIGGDDCNYRNMYLTGNSRFYSRISFPVDGNPETIEDLKKALFHLGEMVTDSKYKGTVELR